MDPDQSFPMDILWSDVYVIWSTIEIEHYKELLWGQLIWTKGNVYYFAKIEGLDMLVSNLAQVRTCLCRENPS